MYTQSYQIKLKDAQPVIIYERGPEERVDEVILPYEVLNVTLEAFDERVITEPATLARMEDRSWRNGNITYSFDIISGPETHVRADPAVRPPASS